MLVIGAMIVFFKNLWERTNKQLKLHKKMLVVGIQETMALG
jgi:hypothetical protein